MKTPKNLKTLAIIFLALAFVGFLDATYLTTQHYLGAIPPCVLTEGCSAVLTSEWSKVFGLPVALLGAVYYLVLLILVVAYLKTGREKFLLTASFMTALGIISSIWLVVLQFFIIKEICFYCMISATTSTALFVVGLFILVKSRRENQTPKSFNPSQVT
ncbi:MAG: vitamin K epoxide reductase family protein [Patescibacteria group bacterium]